MTTKEMTKVLIFITGLSGGIAAANGYWEWVAVVWTALLAVVALGVVDWRKDIR